MLPGARRGGGGPATECQPAERSGRRRRVRGAAGWGACTRAAGSRGGLSEVLPHPARWATAGWGAGGEVARPAGQWPAL